MRKWVTVPDSQVRLYSFTSILTFLTIEVHMRKLALIIAGLLLFGGAIAAEPEDVSTGKPENAVAGKPANVGTGKPENVGTGKPANAGTRKPEKVAAAKPDNIGGSPKANFAANELTIPCVLVESLDDTTDGLFFDIKLLRRGKSFSYELVAAQSEDADMCQAIADFAKMADEDFVEPATP